MWHEYYNPKLNKWLNAGGNYYHYHNQQTELKRNFHPDSTHGVAIRNCGSKVIRTRTVNKTVYYNITEVSLTGTLTLQKIRSELEILMATTPI